MQTLRVIILLFQLIGLFSLADDSSAEESDKLRIGVILPLSGEHTQAGLEFQRGIELVAKERGRLTTIIFENDLSMDQLAAAEAANRLLQQDIDVGLVMRTSQALAVAPQFEARGIPLVVMWDTNQALRDLGPSVFGTGYSTEQTGQAMARNVWQNVTTGPVAIVSEDAVWSQLLVDSFEAGYRAFGGEISFSHILPPSGPADLTALISSIIDSGASALYAPLKPQLLVPLLEGLRQSSADFPVMTGDYLTRGTARSLPASAEGLYFAGPKAPDEESVVSMYVDLYEQEPTDPGLVWLGLRAMGLVFDAIEQTQTDPSSTISHFLQQALSAPATPLAEGDLFRLSGGTTVHLSLQASDPVTPQTALSSHPDESSGDTYDLSTPDNSDVIPGSDIPTPSATPTSTPELSEPNTESDVGELTPTPTATIAPVPTEDPTSASPDSGALGQVPPSSTPPVLETPEQTTPPEEGTSVPSAVVTPDATDDGPGDSTGSEGVAQGTGSSSPASEETSPQEPQEDVEQRGLIEPPVEEPVDAEPAAVDDESSSTVASTPSPSPGDDGLAPPSGGTNSSQSTPELGGSAAATSPTVSTVSASGQDAVAGSGSTLNQTGGASSTPTPTTQSQVNLSASP